MCEYGALSTFHLLSLGEAALAYAAAGIPVFPLKPQDKQPIVQGGFTRATTSSMRIRRWWHQTPLANIGVACGEPSGWWVLDIDPRHGGLESLARLQRDLDQETVQGRGATLLFATLRQLTGGGGAHLVFRRRRELVGTVTTTTNWAGYSGIDVRGERSYLVVAPSVHPQGGIYQWQQDLPLLPFPTELVRLREEQRTRQKQAFSRSAPPFVSRSDPSVHEPRMHRREPEAYLQYALGQAQVGQRNRFACYLACRLVEEVGLEWQAAVPWMLAYVARVPQHDHPYTEQEALSALEWAFRQAQAA
ncbi:MAG TPA: bifunctional DNA primase/polymerase [Ktedonobacteraceae bacterium]|nr:bifunctional DNA primase/polymerase [Ktedonobacteraceae bacterium]